MDKKKWIFLLAAACLTTVIVASVLTYFIVTNRIDTGEIYLKTETYDELLQYFELEKMEEIIGRYYIREADADALLVGTLKGMVEGLGDGYSQFYTEEEYQFFDENSEGSCISEGMLLKIDAVSGYPVVKNVFADTPAYEAGIGVGDYVVAIDGIDTYSMDLDVVLGRIRGIDGTFVELRVQSGDMEDVLTLVRKSPDIQLVFASMVNAKIGYINIVEFSGSSVEEFDSALETVSKEGAEAIVIDLRGTLGGNISQAVEIADKLLDAGTIAYTENKEGTGLVWESDAEELWEKPLVLLVDGDTSGVAEVFAAAIQGRQRGQIVGTTNTAGKAAVTSYFEIQSTGDVIKLLTAEYFSPGGIQIDEEGVLPDVYAEKTSDTEDTTLLCAAELLKAQLEEG